MTLIFTNWDKRAHLPLRMYPPIV
uniref:Uncharacterized protein n=1 Tax=Rhizophora mucronata TaxID=61149 RepID=A0A2P2P8I8_RHIMU